MCLLYFYGVFYNIDYDTMVVVCGYWVSEVSPTLTSTIEVEIPALADIVGVNIMFPYRF